MILFVVIVACVAIVIIFAVASHNQSKNEQSSGPFESMTEQEFDEIEAQMQAIQKEAEERQQLEMELLRAQIAYYRSNVREG